MLPNAPAMAPRLTPYGRVPSLLAFGLPAVLLRFIAWHVMPRLDAAGAAPVFLFALFGVPLLACLVAAFVLYGLEGNPWNWTAFRDRMRLQPMGGRRWLWAVVLAVGGLGLYLGGVRLVDALLPEAPTPEAFDKIFGDAEHFLGHPLKGAWWLLGTWFAFYLVNVLGEELWFRGMVLPRQELAFGKRAWAVHGLCWAGWHAGFFPTDALVILPEALAYGWISQRTRSTWPALIAHAFLNALVSIRLVSGILG